MSFDEWFDRDLECGEADKRRKVSVRNYARGIWDAATEEVKKDHFKIGEEVDILPEIRARVKAKAKDGTWYTYKPADVRRIPAWEPKDGEAVMFPWYNDNNVRTWYAGTYKAGRIYFADDSSVAAVKYCKPFDPDKISKPWDEV